MQCVVYYLSFLQLTILVTHSDYVTLMCNAHKILFHLAMCWKYSQSSSQTPQIGRSPQSVYSCQKQNQNWSKTLWIRILVFVYFYDLSPKSNKTSAYHCERNRLYSQCSNQNINGLSLMPNGTYHDVLRFGHWSYGWKFGNVRQVNTMPELLAITSLAEI